MLRQTASLLRLAALRCRCFSLAKTWLIGVTSGGEEDQPCACGPDGIPDGWALVAAKVVEDHDAPLPGHGVPVPEGSLSDQAPAPHRPSPQRGHVGFGRSPFGANRWRLE